MRGERKRRRERERKREKRKTHFISFQSSGSFHILTVLSSDDETNKLSSSLNSAQNITPYKKNPPPVSVPVHTLIILRGLSASLKHHKEEEEGKEEKGQYPRQVTCIPTIISH